MKGHLYQHYDAKQKKYLIKKVTSHVASWMSMWDIKALSFVIHLFSSVSDKCVSCLIEETKVQSAFQLHFCPTSYRNESSENNIWAPRTGEGWTDKYDYSYSQDIFWRIQDKVNTCPIWHHLPVPQKAQPWFKVGSMQILEIARRNVK